MYQQDLSLKDLVNIEEWQGAQESFAEVLGVSLRTFDLDGKLLTRISRPPRLWTKIPSGIPGYSEYCGSCILKSEAKEKLQAKEAANYKCPFGLDIFAIPIKACGDRVVAYVIAGPLILNKRKDKSEYIRQAKDLKIDPDGILDEIIEINVFTYNKVRAIIRLLNDVFCHMAQTGYHKRRLGEIAPEVIELDPLFGRYYEEKILKAFLNSCTLALDADSGSVMTVDKKTGALHIRAASKLDQNIIDQTSVKLGDGIAGMAAATARSIMLPKDKKKNGLSMKMKRRHIKSSMIVPFGKENKDGVYGVINLNIVRRERDFTQKDITLVKELINLTSIALAPIQQ